MAVVELAQDTELGRTVAVKLLADNLARDRALRERFLREARLAAGLAHPNVVRVFDAGEDDGRPFIVMEYVDGQTVDELLRSEGRLSPNAAVEVAIQVCAGLEAAHAAGLVHRDIKPQNLLVRADGVLKIADFGIARMDDGTRLTATGTVLGTAAYLAPEQASGEDVTAAADIYALGAVLYELLTGRPPRRVETLAALVPSLDEPIAPVRELAPEIPSELELVVMRCLARHPQYRPPSAAELAAELAGACPEAPTQPLPAPTGVRATEVLPRRHRSEGRRYVLVFLAAALVAGLASLLGLALVSGGGSPKPAPLPRLGLVQPASDPAEQARNLSTWLRENSR